MGMDENAGGGEDGGTEGGEQYDEVEGMYGYGEVGEIGEEEGSRESRVVAVPLPPLVKRMLGDIQPDNVLKRLDGALHALEWKQLMPTLTDDELVSLAQELYDLFQGSQPMDQQADVMGLVNRFYPTDMMTPTSRIYLFTKFYQTRYFELFVTLCERASIKYQTNKELQRKLAVVIHRISHAHTIRSTMSLIRETSAPQFNLSFSHFDQLLMCDNDSTRMKVFQQSLLVALQSCHRRHYVRKGEHIYDRVYHGNTFVHCYKYLQTIQEFVYTLSDTPVSSEAWKVLTDSHNTQEHIVKYLTNCDNEYLPLHNADRYWLAFTNGVYHTHKDQFYTFDQVPPGVVCCNFIDKPFEYFPERRNAMEFWPEGVYAETDDQLPEASEMDWFHIPTPNFDRIFRTQWKAAGPGVPDECVVENPEIVLRFNWAFLARAILWWLNEKDHWQKHYTIVGASGVGKSVLQNVLRRIFQAEDIGAAATRMEKTFGLAGIHDKYVWMISEMSADFQMDYADWLSIVVGETVLIRDKYKTAFPFTWRAPGFSIGNEPAAWRDRRGAYSRRLIYNLFNGTIQDGNRDGNLETECLKELPRIILKMSRAYRGLYKWMKKIGTTDIDKVWPKMYKTNITKFRTGNDPIEGFLDEGPLVFGQNLYMPWPMFKAAFVEYQKTSTFRKITLDENTIKAAFTAHSLSLSDSGGHKNDTARWVYGCDLRDQPQAQPVQDPRRQPPQQPRPVDELLSEANSLITQDEHGRDFLVDQPGAKDKLRQTHQELKQVMQHLRHDSEEHYDATSMAQKIESVLAGR